MILFLKFSLFSFFKMHVTKITKSLVKNSKNLGLKGILNHRRMQNALFDKIYGNIKKNVKFTM